MRPSATTPVRAVLVGVQVALLACGEGSTARHHTTQHHTTDTPQQWSRAELSLADNASVALTSILNNAVTAVNETVAKFDADLLPFASPSSAASAKPRSAIAKIWKAHHKQGSAVVTCYADNAYFGYYGTSEKEQVIIWRKGGSANCNKLSNATCQKHYNSTTSKHCEAVTTGDCRQTYEVNADPNLSPKSSCTDQPECKKNMATMDLARMCNAPLFAVSWFKNKDAKWSGKTLKDYCPQGCAGKPCAYKNQRFNCTEQAWYKDDTAKDSKGNYVKSGTWTVMAGLANPNPLAIYGKPVISHCRDLAGASSVCSTFVKKMKRQCSTFVPKSDDIGCSGAAGCIYKKDEKLSYYCAKTCNTTCKPKVESVTIYTVPLSVLNSTLASLVNGTETHSTTLSLYVVDNNGNVLVLGGKSSLVDSWVLEQCAVWRLKRKADSSFRVSTLPSRASIQRVAWLHPLRSDCPSHMSRSDCSFYMVEHVTTYEAIDILVKEIPGVVDLAWKLVAVKSCNNGHILHGHECVDVEEGPPRWEQGMHARYEGRTGVLTMNPDSDFEVKLRWKDGEVSRYIGVSNLTAATEAEKAQYSGSENAAMCDELCETLVSVLCILMLAALLVGVSADVAYLRGKKTGGDDQLISDDQLSSSLAMDQLS